MPQAKPHRSRDRSVSPSTSHMPSLSSSSPHSTSGTVTPSEPKHITLAGGAGSPNPSTIIYDEEPTWPKGWRPWGCLFGCFLLMFNSWGIVNAYGTFSSYYLQTLIPGVSILLLNLIGSTQSAVVLLLSLVVGRFLDAGHARKLVCAGAVLVTLGMFLISVVNGDGKEGDGNYALIWLVQGLVTGLGMACFFVSSSQIAATWFIKRKSIAVGIVASGASIAGLVYPLMLRFLTESVGWNNAVRYVGTLTGGTTLLSLLLCVPNPRHQIRKPEKWLSSRVFFDMEAFKDPAFNWFTAAICFLFFGFYAVFFNVEEWAAFYNFGIRGNEFVQSGTLKSFWLLAIMNASSTVGRILSASFAERFGTVNIHTICTFVSALLCLCLWTVAKDLNTGIAFCVTFGAVSGAVIGLPPASMADILGMKDPARQARLGQWVGMMYSASAVFALTGPVTAGYLASKYRTMLTIQLWAGACLFLSACCMAMARFYKGQYQGGGLRSLRSSIAELIPSKSVGEKEEV